jgi:PleD family two-component response regulator
VSVTTVTDPPKAVLTMETARPPTLCVTRFSYTDYPTIRRPSRLREPCHRKLPGHAVIDWSMSMVSDPIKILIVDDDEQVLIELERLLESEGYSTSTAWGGLEALALSDQLQFDILLVDEDMTYPNCCALLSELKRRQPRLVASRCIRARLAQNLPRMRYASGSMRR